MSLVVDVAFFAGVATVAYSLGGPFWMGAALVCASIGCAVAASGGLE